MTYPELTPEEKAKRAQIAELRGQIKKLAATRRLILDAYRLPHKAPEHQKALDDACVKLEITNVGQWQRHCIPGRFWWRDEVHALHLQLAELTGRPHAREPLPAAV